MPQLTLTTLADGPRNAITHASFLSDGSGDLVDVDLINPMDFNPPMPPRPALNIYRLWYDFTGFDARLEFDYLSSDTPIWTMSGGRSNQIDFEMIGGLTDRSNELDGSGKLQITTSGFDAGDFGTLIIWARKS